VRLAGPEHHARDQDADARTGFHCSERRHRIFEPNNFKESRAQRCHGKVTNILFIVNHDHSRWHGSNVLLVQVHPRLPSPPCGGQQRVAAIAAPVPCQRLLIARHFLARGSYFFSTTR